MEFGITIKPDLTDRPHRQPHAPGRIRRLPSRLDLRLPRHLDGAVPADDADGRQHEEDAPRSLRHESRRPRRHRRVQSLRHSQSDFQRSHANGHRPRRQFAPRPRQKANHARSIWNNFVKTFRELNAGQVRSITKASPPHFPGPAEKVPPVWVAGYGPKALRTAGRIGDGVILQFADPDLIAWCLGFVREGAKEAGRDFSKIEVMAAAPVWASNDLKIARDRVRWFPHSFPIT